jgi:uncharacterized protein
MKTIRQLIRRRMLKGMAASSAFGLFSCATASSTPADGSAALTFTELGRTRDDKSHVAPGHDQQVLIRHGDPIRRGGPAYRPGRQTGEEQEQQFGSENDFLAFLPLPRGSGSSTRGLLGANHEYHSPRLVWPGMTGPAATREQCEVQLAAHGFSVLEIEKTGNAWRVVDDSRYNRRITVNTPMRASGPAAGHARMRTSYDPTGTRPIGTLNNCAGGVSPWQTILTAEENYQFYFAPSTRYVWGRHFDRFNVEREPNEANRFGWIVEIDPYDPQSTPVKRTALGRFSHECATCAVSHDGRVAVYSGDDSRDEFVYKFVTRNPLGGKDLLDEGTLYAARFEANGRMRWLPLVHGQGPLAAANGFTSQVDVLIDARRAARLLGATPMDRPEDVEAHPASGRIYVVCTYNERRKPGEVNPANPRGPNPYGHIVEIVPPIADGKPDHTAIECEWGFFMLAGNPTDPKHGARYANPVSANGWVAAPDNVAFDPKGRIWISTDGQEGAAGFNDSLYPAATSGPARGATRCFFNGPSGAEICGPCFTPDGRTLFLSVQHPGEGSSFDKPSTRWPDFQEGVPPRSAVVAITRKDGGEIGG